MAANPRIIRLWTCEICGHEGEWSEGFNRYGSLLEQDIDPSRMVVVCANPECIEQAPAKHKQKNKGKRSLRTYGRTWH